MYDSNNHIVQLCAQGMDLEGSGKNHEALDLFQQAWHLATNDLEKFIAAHYVARHQKDVRDKLRWDLSALALAQQVDPKLVESALPSLYLNIAKCYEDLNDIKRAKEYYELAYKYSSKLYNDGYSEMIKSGIANGIQRVTNITFHHKAG